MVGTVVVGVGMVVVGVGMVAGMVVGMAVRADTVACARKAEQAEQGTSPTADFRPVPSRSSVSCVRVFAHRLRLSREVLLGQRRNRTSGAPIAQMRATITTSRFAVATTGHTPTIVSARPPGCHCPTEAPVQYQSVQSAAALAALRVVIPTGVIRHPVNATFPLRLAYVYRATSSPALGSTSRFADVTVKRTTTIATGCKPVSPRPMTENVNRVNSHCPRVYGAANTLS